MEITLKMIDELRERKNVSYSDAKEALENSDGDMVDAIIYLERNSNVKEEKKEKEKFISKFKKFINRIFDIKIDILKGEKIELRLPLIILLILALPLLPLFIIGAGIYLILGYKIKVINGDNEVNEINDAFEKVSKVIKGDE